MINRQPTVSPEIAARVEDAIRLLDYHPNVAAVSLRGADHKTSTIGLLLEDVANPFSSTLHGAVEDTARRHGMLVFAGSSDEDPDRETLARRPCGGDRGRITWRLEVQLVPVW